MSNQTPEIPGMSGPFTICTCMCHGKEVCMHCMPCCDKTYEQYSPKLWKDIPELQGALDEIKVHSHDKSTLQSRLAAYKAKKNGGLQE